MVDKSVDKRWTRSDESVDEGGRMVDKTAGFPGVFLGLSRRLSHGVFSVIRSLTRNSSARRIPAQGHGHA
jgi:hypothetical protein